MVRIKSKWSPCLIKNHALTRYEAVDEYLQIHTFLISALDGGEWSVSHLDQFTSNERTFVTDWMEGFKRPRAELKAAVKRRFCTPAGN
jgi:hypothetical protein